MMNKDEAIKQTLKDIEAMEAVNAALPAIKKVIANWDGKVFNKRIEADLKALDLPGNIYMSTYDENRWSIDYTVRDSGQTQHFTILYTLRPSNKYFDPEKSFLNADKRLSREKAFEQIEAGRVERLQRIAAYREHLATWEEKEKMLDILRKQINTITSTIPYTMQDYFGIRRKYY
jgi:hypothetical protein